MHENKNNDGFAGTNGRNTFPVQSGQIGILIRQAKARLDPISINHSQSSATSAWQNVEFMVRRSAL